jgi:hypothetical protein
MSPTSPVSVITFIMIPAFETVHRDVRLRVPCLFVRILTLDLGPLSLWGRQGSKAVSGACVGAIGGWPPLRSRSVTTLPSVTVCDGTVVFRGRSYTSRVQKTVPLWGRHAFRGGRGTRSRDVPPGCNARYVIYVISLPDRIQTRCRAHNDSTSSPGPRIPPSSCLLRVFWVPSFPFRSLPFSSSHGTFSSVVVVGLSLKLRRVLFFLDRPLLLLPPRRADSMSRARPSPLPSWNHPTSTR